MNIEEGREVKKIKVDNKRIYGVKKIKMNKKGESLIVADGNGNLRLYSI